MFPNVTNGAAAIALKRDKHFKTFAYNKYHNLFEHKQVVKYTVWFNNLSKNSDKTVVLDSLAQEFVNHKLIRSKVELINAFSTFLKAKIKKNDITYTVNIDDFLDVLSKSSRVIDMDKLNEVVDMENKLSEKTLLIHERRKLLFEYVVEDRLNRASDMDEICHRSFNKQLTTYHQRTDTGNTPEHNRVEEKQKEKEKEKIVLEGHRKQIEDANRFVGKVEFDLYCMKYGNKMRLPSKSSKDLILESAKVDIAEAAKVLQPLESIFDSDLLAMTKETRKILYEDTVNDKNFNNMLSPTMVSSSGSRRLAEKCSERQPSCVENKDNFHYLPATTSVLSTSCSPDCSTPNSSSRSMSFSASSRLRARGMSHQTQLRATSATAAARKSLARTSPRTMVASPLSARPAQHSTSSLADSDCNSYNSSISCHTQSSCSRSTGMLSRPHTAMAQLFHAAEINSDSDSFRASPITLRKKSLQTGAGTSSLMREPPHFKLKINFSKHEENK